MLHELSHGKILAYRVNLSSLSPERFSEVYDKLNAAAFDLKVVPSEQTLIVYWNFEEPLSSFIPCPAEWVFPHL